MLRCWKVFLMHFYADRRTKYAFESLRSQFQLASLPPHLVSQLSWIRFVNTHGHNIPCDLHINCLFKDIVGNMGSNFTQEASSKAARRIVMIAKLKFTHRPQHTPATAHTRKSDDNDRNHRNLVVKVVMESKLLHIIPDRI